MPVPIDHAMLARIQNMPKIDFSQFNEAECEAECMADCRLFDEELKTWLSYYDDNGYLRPGARSDPGYAADMRYVPADLSDEEAAAFIVSEKKRLGLL